MRTTSEGRRVLMTGATGSLGEPIARALLADGWRLTVAVRDLAKARAMFGDRARIVPLELDSLASVRALVQSELNNGEPLDLLMHVAGMFRQTGCRTRDGNELHYQTNYLAPALLTQGLLPLLRRAERPCVVTITSLAAFNARIDPNDPQAWLARNPIRVYGRSKRLLLLAMERMADGDPTIRFTAAHPGISATQLFALPKQGAPRAAFTAGFTQVVLPLMRLVFMKPSSACQSALYAVRHELARGRLAQPNGLLHVWGKPAEGAMPRFSADDRLIEKRCVDPPIFGYADNVLAGVDNPRTE